MTAGSLSPPKVATKNVVRPALVAVCALGFVAAAAGTMLAPLLLGRLYSADQDFSRAGDIGQAYGAASAMIATLALGLVSIGLVMQYRQTNSDRLQALSQTTAELVRLAMEEPVYRQCWGARIAPDGMDEDVFYYCNKVLNSWKRAWELRDLSEAQARSYLANFFDSEVPRLFWQMHGSWHMRAKPKTRREQFLELVNDEYLRAEKRGAPARRYEPRRRSTAERDLISPGSGRTRRP